MNVKQLKDLRHRQHEVLDPLRDTLGENWGVVNDLVSDLMAMVKDNNAVRDATLQIRIDQLEKQLAIAATANAKLAQDVKDKLCSEYERIRNDKQKEYNEAEAAMLEVLAEKEREVDKYNDFIRQSIEAVKVHHIRIRSIVSSLTHEDDEDVDIYCGCLQVISKAIEEGRICCTAQTRAGIVYTVGKHDEEWNCFVVKRHN